MCSVGRESGENLLNKMYAWHRGNYLEIAKALEEMDWEVDLPI